MSTASEILLMHESAMRRLAQNLEVAIQDMIVYGTHVAMGREVCARRARKLRKRGEDVRYARSSATGKARYRWMKRIAPWAIYKALK